MASSDTTPAARVLIVDDEAVVQRYLVQVLERAGHVAETAASGADALRALDRELFDVVLVDVGLPGMGGLEVLAAGRAVQTDAQFVVMTGSRAVDTAVEAMKLGAFDYIAKPVGMEELLLVVDRALRETELRREVSQLRRTVAIRGQGGMIGKSPALKRVLNLVERVAPTRATVLITGETGTGKELVARAIHDASDRTRAAFVAINCSALPETLLESELFGYMRGSFTGAVQNKRGLFEEANGGTLFLDEISTISPAIQVKLLRALQERQVQRIGGSHPVPVDFRLITAGSLQLSDEVAAGRFREDLYYRLAIFPILVPPLRERKADIPLLANHFRLRFAQENGVEPPEIAAETMRRLLDHDWPGNIRELENFIERSVILHAGAGTIPFERPAARKEEETVRYLIATATREQWSLDRLERAYILEVLEKTNGHQIRAAEVLGIDRRTLYRKLKQYRLESELPGALRRTG